MFKNKAWIYKLAAAITFIFVIGSAYSEFMLHGNLLKAVQACSSGFIFCLILFGISELLEDQSKREK